MQKSDAARIIAGLTPAETKQSSAPTSVHVMSGEVVGNSESGKVQIRMDGDVVSPDDDQIIEVDAIGGLEEGDTATILLTGQPGRAMTPMAMGSSGSVDRIVERIRTIEADYVKATEIEAEVGTFGYLKAADLEAEVAEFGYLKANELEAEVAEFGYLKADDLEAEVAEFGYLKANSATITDLQADTAKIHNLSANDISAATGYIHDLTSGNVTAQNIIADHGDFSTVKANAAKVANLTAQELEADHATIANLDSSYAQIDMANVNNAWIENGLIKDAAIKSEMVESISANQLTAGEIDADEITVRNLKASSLTVQTADGYVYVGEKRIPTKEFIDSLKDELQNEIDGAIETFTVSAVPTLNNTPANEWVVSGDAEATRKLRAKHVGDIVYVVNSSSAQNGYCYRFAYDATNQEFKWVLIKDSDVTAALSRLSTAEGKITGLETFESNTTSWIEETDEGLETIRTNHTNLAGVVDKTVVETKQLWFTKNNTTAPDKPTAAVTSPSTAGNAWRVVVPAWNASYPNYYYCLQYKLADSTYAWSDVVRDIAMGESQQQGRKGVADAATADGKAVSAQNTANANIKSSVQLWFTKVNNSAPTKPSGTTPITVNDSTKTNQWNLAIPTYNSGYPHYFYCYQQQKGDGTYQWSDVVYDRSVTEAQAKAQAALPSSAFTTFQSTTFKNLVDTVDEQSSTITQLSDSVSSVGNILTGNVANPSNWIISAPSGASYTKEAYGTAGVKVTFNSVGGYEWLYSQPISVTSGNKYMVFFDYTVAKAYVSTSGKSGYGLAAYSGSNAPSGSYDDGNARFLGKAEFSKTASGDRVLKGSFTFTATSDSIILGLNGGHIADNQTDISFTIDNLVVGETLSTTSTTVNSVKQTADSNRTYLTNLTTTLGTNADGTSKSEDIVHKYNQLDQTLDGTISRVGATETKLETISNPNLSPFFSMAPYRTATSYDGGYWQPTNENWLMGGVTRLSDGWAHVTRGASTRLEVAIPRIESLSAGDKATLMIEWRNITVTGSPKLYVRNYPENCQFNLNSYETTWNTSSATSGSRLIVMTVNSTAGGDMNWNAAIDLGMSNGSGVSFDGDLRISLYEGEYDGPYKPYVDQSLIERVSTAETSIDQTSNNVLIKATKSDTTAAQGGQHLIQSLINVAPEGVKIAADKVNIEGAAIFTSGRLSSTSLNNAYDAKGSASAVQENLDNLQVGGRNLVWDTAWNDVAHRWKTWGSPTTREIVESGGKRWLHIVTTTSRYQGYEQGYSYRPKDDELTGGDVVTASVTAYAASACTTSLVGFHWMNSSNQIVTQSWPSFNVTTTPQRFHATFTVPSSASRFNIMVGDSTTTANELWISEVKFEKGNRATDWTPAPEDVDASIAAAQSTANANVKRTQRIYYRKSATGAPGVPTAWVVNGNVESSWTKYNAWSTRVPPIADSTSSTTKYLYLYTCEQYETAGGTTPQYTTVLLDDSTTVIDGGTIITGSIAANRLDVYDASINKIKAEAIDLTGVQPAGSYATTSALTTETNQRKAQYGTCSTAAGTAAKAVTCANFELVAGNELTVKFTTANTASAPTLNVNSKGAKNVWVGNAVASSTNQLLWGANAYITFRYDGTQFQVIGEPRTWYGACTTAEGTAAKTDTTAVTGCVVCKGAKVELAMTNANTAASPTLNIQSTGAKAVYFGNSTTRPTKSGGTSWLAANTCTFTFDGAAWRTQGKTYIDANSIVTGYLSANRIEAGSITAGKLDADSIKADIVQATDLSATQIKSGKISADYIDVSSISIGDLSGSIETGGRNYAKTNVAIGTTSTSNGVTFTVVGSSTVKLSGTATSTGAGTNNWFGGLTLDPGTYSLWLTNTNNGTIWFRLGKGASRTHVWSTSGNYTRDTPYVFKVDTADTYWFGVVCAAGTYSNVETSFMLERGSWGTSWVPATEDVSQYRVVTTNYSYTLSQWLTYSAEGYTGSWSTNTSGQGVRVGDTVMLKGTNKDTGDPVYVLLTINTLSSSGAIKNATSHGLIDPTAGTRADSYITDITSGGMMVHPSNDKNTGVQITDKIDIKAVNKVMNRIDTSGMTLYDGNGVADGNIVAKFASKLIELGKNAPDAIIRLCGGKLDLTYFHDTDTGIQYGSLYSQNYMRVLSGTDSPSGDSAYGSVSASQSQGHMSGGVSAGYKNGTTLKTSSLSANVAVSESETPNVSAHVYSGTTSSGTEASFKLDLSGFSINGSTPIKAIYAGSTVEQLSNGKWLSLANATTVSQVLGSGASQTNTVCIAQNGGFNSYAGVVTGAMGSDGSARAYIYPNHTGYIRINFILIRFA